MGKVQDIVKEIRTALVDLGLVPEGSLHLIDRIFGDIEFKKALLEYIDTWIEGMGDMFKFHDGPGTEMKNYYGLLLGHLLKSDQVEALAEGVIVEFMLKQANFENVRRLLFPEKVIAVRKQEAEAFLKPHARKLTMKQLYDLTGMELTVASADLTSQTLRFFNHKTSPQLPVVKAVVLTGSYPVAFKPPVWEAGWGKYYVHYDRWRKEVDLTGHEFTDGGTLANFPLMYLDN